MKNINFCFCFQQDKSGADISLLNTNHVADASLMRTKISYLIQNSILQHSIDNDTAVRLLQELPPVDLPDIAR